MVQRLALGLLLWLAGEVVAAPLVSGIPLKSDPPFAIDGDLAEWAAVPNAVVLDQAAQCTWGRAAWRGAADLSARVQLAWRTDGLYLAVDVTDDVVRQEQRGDSIWKSDHVELYLDVLPDLEPARQSLGAGQFQMAFSPGNFRQTGDPLVDIAPEAFVYQPAGMSADGLRVASRRTAAGYTIEALVPWTKLGLSQVSEGQPIRFEVGISDTDGPEGKQEKMLTVSTAPWAIQRGRFVEACLAGTTGVAQPRASQVALAPAVTVPTGGQQTLTFAAPTVPAGRDAVLAFRARLDFARVAGYNAALKLTLNGRPVTGERFVRRPVKAASAGGSVYSLATGDCLAVYYAPDYTSADQDAHYGLLDGVKACEFDLRVTDLLRPGDNQLVVEHATKVKSSLHLADVRLEFQVPPPPPKPKAGPPTGPLATLGPTPVRPVAYEVQELAAGALAVKVAGRTFTISNRYSSPHGWVTGANPDYQFRRELERRPEAVVVRETITNPSAANLGLIQRHTAVADAAVGDVYVGGLRRPTGRATLQDPANPSVFVTAGQAGLGLLPLSDVFRVHSTSFAAEGQFGLADDCLVLAPGATQVVEWAIFPVAAPDYWTFLNAARRLVDANFLLDGGFAFLRAEAWLNDKWSNEQVANFIRHKDARYVCASIPNVGHGAAHGTIFQHLPAAAYDQYRKVQAQRRQLVPGTKCLVYFHCFLDVTPDGPTRFKDARVLRIDGRQADYGEDIYKLYCPTATNSYGPEIARNVDVILDDLKADGVYWDEHEYSAYRYSYGEGWDGCSGDLEPATGQIVRLKSSVTLRSESWRLQLARRILARGPLIGNGPPTTRAMAALKFACFVETGSITNCAQNQLYSPIALGDHLTERSERDAYRVMLRALDYGCLYHWYNDVTVIPTHHALTRYMYPITPVELHAGTVIGTDRLLTNRSGRYGLGDASPLVVHVFNDQGVEQPEFKAPLITQEGQTFVELRLAEDWSAAVLKAGAATR